MKKPRCPICNAKLPAPKKVGRKRIYCIDVKCRQLASLQKKIRA